MNQAVAFFDEVIEAVTKMIGEKPEHCIPLFASIRSENHTKQNQTLFEKLQFLGKIF